MKEVNGAINTAEMAFDIITYFDVSKSVSASLNRAPVSPYTAMYV
jgi:hypothetical protein